jgi:hypothetical protein
MVTSYTTLLSSISGWLNSAQYDARIPEFIQMAEAHFNRELRVPQMEVTATSTATTESVTLPTDFLAARTVFLDDDPDVTLTAMALSQLRYAYPNSAAGITVAYAVSGSEIILAPAPSDDVTVTLAYYQQIPALSSDNETNWLITSHPDLYLHAVKHYAFDYMRDEDKADRELIKVAAIISSINLAGRKQQLPAGPLAMRPSASA